MQAERAAEPGRGPAPAVRDGRSRRALRACRPAGGGPHAVAAGPAGRGTAAAAAGEGRDGPAGGAERSYRRGRPLCARHTGTLRGPQRAAEARQLRMLPRPRTASLSPCTGRSGQWADSVGDAAPTDAAPDEEALRYDPADISRRLEQADEALASLRAVWPTSAGRSPRRETPCASRRSWSSSAAGSPTPRRQTPPWSWRPRPCAAPMRRSAHVFHRRSRPRRGHILAELTENKYPRVLLEPDMHLSVREADGQVMRPAAAMSCGTADQMYLALRLAMCRRLLPPDAPMCSTTRS